jgi:hypothetical protein
LVSVLRDGAIYQRSSIVFSRGNLWH